MLAKAKGGPSSKATMSVARMMSIYDLKRPDIFLYLLINPVLHKSKLNANGPGNKKSC
jgi:hypothetical protein